MYLPMVYVEIEKTPYYYHTHGLSKVKSWSPERLVSMLEKDGYLTIERDHKTNRFECVVWISREKFNSEFIKKYLEGKDYRDYQEMVINPQGRVLTTVIVTQVVLFAGVAYWLYYWGFRL